MTELQAIDFFCSAGGVSCGFRQAGIDVLGGVDIDQNCKKTYEINNHAKFLCADVSLLPKSEIGSYFSITKDQDELIFVGCSPCQYYSNMTTDKSKSKKSRLLLADFQEFVEYYRPGYVFIENVPGIDTKRGSPIGKFKMSLKRNGYVYKDGILNAKHFGVPQNRRRYILLASRIKKEISFPKGSPESLVSVRDAIGNEEIFPPIEAGHQDKSDFIHSASFLEDTNLKRIKATPHNGGDRRIWKHIPELQVNCYQNHDGHYDVYGRMYWDKPSPTITTRFNSLSNGRYGHPEQDRAISLREGATLQSFPLDYIFFSVNQNSIAKMIGNAVPPLLAQKIGQSILNS